MDGTRTTALHAWHLAHGAKMTEFGGWDMPVQYSTGAIQEHIITRRSAGLFDIDHMGQIAVSGPDAGVLLQETVTSPLSSMKDFTARYALFLNEKGGVLDDLFAYKLPGLWILVVNASNREKDLAWLKAKSKGKRVKIEDFSDSTYMIALQGPKALALMSRLTGEDFSALARLSVLETAVGTTVCSIAKTGYTGEDGVEILCSEQHALALWETILDAGKASGIEVSPVGLAARDSLRFEAGFPLYGHEIDDSTSPLEAGLGWACTSVQNYIGKAALERLKASGLRKKLVTIELTQPGVPRPGYPVLDGEHKKIGTVVSGMFCPSLKKYCANAFVKPEYAHIGSPVEILIREVPKTGMITKRPLYTPSYKRKA